MIIPSFKIPGFAIQITAKKIFHSNAVAMASYFYDSPVPSHVTASRRHLTKCAVEATGQFDENHTDIYYVQTAINSSPSTHFPSIPSPRQSITRWRVAKRMDSRRWQTLVGVPIHISIISVVIIGGNSQQQQRLKQMTHL